MCGISVLFDGAPKPDGASRLLRMHGPIRHRGPDEERFLFVDDAYNARLATATDDSAPPFRLGMAFRRLRVIDLSEAASQPMRSAARNVWLCFNGEIYNYQSLRQQLAAEYPFRSHSDSEVILAAYEKWGTGCFEHLDGMWAIVLADLDRRMLVVSRDRFGIKPLYWSMQNDRILIASEIKQILAASDTLPATNEPLVAAFLRGNRVPVLHETFFRGINPFPQACLAELPLDGAVHLPEPRAFWDLGSIEQRSIPGREYAAAVDDVESKLRHAVRTHNVADVNVGYLVSGGLDSSTLAALMAADARSNGHAPAPGFSFGFRDRAPGFCELKHADSVARHHRLRLHETTFDGRWVESNAGNVMRALEEPALGMAALAQYRVFELCREHGMTVVIDGEASDEVFAGYPNYQLQLLRGYVEHGRLAAFARELHAMARYEERTSFAIAWEIVERRMRVRRNRLLWLDPEYGADMQRRQEAAAAIADHGRQTSRVGRTLFRDVKWGNVKIVLGYTDRFAMAHSLEARVPYLDLELVRTAFSLPDEFKVGRGQRKRVLRDVARRYLPAGITERKDRMGFGVPEAKLLREVWPEVQGHVRALSGSKPFLPGSVDRIVSQFSAGDDTNIREVWRLYSLARWSEEFGVAL